MIYTNVPSLAKAVNEFKAVTIFCSSSFPFNWILLIFRDRKDVGYSIINQKFNIVWEIVNIIRIPFRELGSEG